MGASLRSARAIERRWRSPPESVAPALADDRVVAVGQALDEGVRVGRPGRRLDLRARGARTPVGDVLGDREREQEGLLEDDRDLLADAAQADLAQVVAVDRDAARPGVDEPGHEAREGALARPRRAHERHGLARARLEPDAPQHRPAGLVAEDDALHADMAAHRRQGRRARPLHDLGRRVEDLGDTAQAPDRLADRRRRVGDRLERAVHRGEVGEEDEHRPDRQPTAEDRRRPDPQDRSAADRQHQAEDRLEPELDGRQAERRLQGTVGRRAEARVLAVLAREDLHDRVRRESPLAHRVDGCLCLFALVAAIGHRHHVAREARAA